MSAQNETVANAKGAEGRRARRIRTRLRPAKIFCERGRFVTDCAFFDISATGARLRLCGKHEQTIPHRVRIFDEVDKTMRDGEVMWRGAARELGVRFIQPAGDGSA